MFNKKIIIVGAGLAGLVTTIDCAKNAYKYPDTEFHLQIIEKRSAKVNRRQKLILSHFNSFNYHSKFPAALWQEYCEKTFDPYGEIKRKFNNPKKEAPANKREKFLFKLWHQQNYSFNPLRGVETFKNFSIKDLQLALYEHIHENTPPNIKLEWHYATTVKSINVQTQEIEIENKDEKTTTKLKFDDIVNCEGSKGEFTKLIQETIPDSFQFIPFSFPTLYHCAVRLKLKQNDPGGNAIKLFSPTKTNEELLKDFRTQYPNASSPEVLLKKLQKLGYQSDTLPIFFAIEDNLHKYKYDDNFHLRLFVACEIPQFIHNMTDKELKRQTIIDWTKLIAAMAYGISEEYFEFDKKGETEESQINALTFDNELKYVENPVLSLSDSSKIYLVGDACMSNFYPLGFSSVIAATEAQLVGEILCRPNAMTQQYNELYNQYRFFVRDELVGFNKTLHRDFPKEYQVQQKFTNNRP